MKLKRKKSRESLPLNFSFIDVLACALGGVILIFTGYILGTLSQRQQENVKERIVLSHSQEGQLQDTIQSQKGKQGLFDKYLTSEDFQKAQLISRFKQTRNLTESIRRKFEEAVDTMEIQSTLFEREDSAYMRLLTEENVQMSWAKQISRFNTSYENAAALDILKQDSMSYKTLKENFDALPTLKSYFDELIDLSKSETLVHFSSELTEYDGFLREYSDNNFVSANKVAAEKILNTLFHASPEGINRIYELFAARDRVRNIENELMQFGEFNLVNQIEGLYPDLTSKDFLPIADVVTKGKSLFGDTIPIALTKTLIDNQSLLISHDLHRAATQILKTKEKIDSSNLYSIEEFSTKLLSAINNLKNHPELENLIKRYGFESKDIENLIKIEKKFTQELNALQKKYNLNKTEAYNLNLLLTSFKSNQDFLNAEILSEWLRINGLEDISVKSAGNKVQETLEKRIAKPKAEAQLAESRLISHLEANKYFYYFLILSSIAFTAIIIYQNRQQKVLIKVQKKLEEEKKRIQKRVLSNGKIEIMNFIEVDDVKRHVVACYENEIIVGDNRLRIALTQLIKGDSPFHRFCQTIKFTDENLLFYVYPNGHEIFNTVCEIVAKVGIKNFATLLR